MINPRTFPNESHFEINNNEGDYYNNRDMTIAAVVIAIVAIIVSFLWVVYYIPTGREPDAADFVTVYHEVGKPSPNSIKAFTKKIEQYTRMNPLTLTQNNNSFTVWMDEKDLYVVPCKELDTRSLDAGELAGKEVKITFHKDDTIIDMIYSISNAKLHLHERNIINMFLDQATLASDELAVILHLTAVNRALYLVNV